tara:strand:- start:192 stop:419 length:228 start_codon:yes stop_codon:yes gene_type:complete
MTTSRYYTLAIRAEGVWSAQFGSYDLDEVRDERRDAHESGLGPVPYSRMAIVHSVDDWQSTIDADIANLNRGGVS